MVGRHGRSTISFVLGTTRLLLRAWGATNFLAPPSDLRPAPESLQRRSERLATALGIQQIDLEVWPHPRVDAIPIGTQAGGTLVLTGGLLELLDEEALEAVIAHELAHIRLGHARTFGMWLLLGIVGVVAVVASRERPRSGLLAGTIGSAIVGLSLLALTRRYEREADELAMNVLDDPTALARAVLIVRTSDPQIDPRTYQPTTQGRFRGILSIYPRPETRIAAARARTAHVGGPIDD